MSDSRETLRELVAKWPHDRCECGETGQLSHHAAGVNCPSCRRCQVEAALAATPAPTFAEQVEKGLAALVPTEPAGGAQRDSIVAQLTYYAQFGLHGSTDDPIYQGVLKIFNSGFELAHESAKCGHARANYRDPNYIPGVSTESDSSKCEFCEALKAAALAAAPQEQAGTKEE